MSHTRAAYKDSSAPVSLKSQTEEGSDRESSASTTGGLGPLWAGGPAVRLGSSTQGTFKPPSIQPKLTVNDKYEREAERVADAVMQISEEEKEAGIRSQITVPQIQRLQPRSGQAKISEKQEATPIREAVEGAREAGRPLSDQKQLYFEERIGADFNDVRIHTGGKADRAARSISARAYTLGTDIVFRSGEYQPDSNWGRGLLAHELTHVVQQKGMTRRQLQPQMEEESAQSRQQPSREYTFEPMHIEGRKPRDVTSIAEEIIQLLESVWFTEAPGIVALELRNKFQKHSLSKQELMEVLRELRARGWLGEVLEYIHVVEFKSYLQSKGVPWDFIFQYYDPGVTAGAQVFAGFVAGIGEDIYDVLHFVYVLTGSFFSEELARQRAAFVEGIQKLLTHPIVTAQKGFEEMRQTFIDRIYNLNFFGAGRMIAKITMAVIDVVGMAKALPKVATSIAKGAAKVGRISMRAIEDLGVSMRALFEFATQPRQLQMTTPNGFKLSYSQRDILVTRPDGTPAGKISRQQVLQSSSFKERGGVGGGEQPSIEDLTPSPEEAGRALDEIEERAKRGSDSPNRVSGPRVESLEELVGLAIDNVRADLRSEWLPARHFGTKLHSELEALARTHFDSASELAIAAERSLDQFDSVPSRVKEMSIEEFVDQSPVLKPYKSELRRAFGSLEGRVGAKKPDLVIRGPAQTIVWDLTSRSRPVHLAKTLFYAEVLRRGDEMVLIGETYWRHFREGFDPEAYYGVSGARRAEKTEEE